MISLSLALSLRESGLQWHPTAGDRFTISAPEMAGEVFHLADMVVEARTLTSGTVLAFNGTTEWALDSVDQKDAVWLPDETHLRDALGDAFNRLSLCDGHLEVEISIDGERRLFVDEEVENSYAQALLAVLTHG
ncbi:MAG: pilus assembly protein CpaE [Arachnia sp.]